MHSRPRDLSDAAVAEAAQAGWELPPCTASYQAVGYGSHHWLVVGADGGRWFVSVDVLPSARPDVTLARLASALEAAAVARESHLPFVVAPLRTAQGSVVRRLTAAYAMTVYPFVDGRSGRFGDPLDDRDGEDVVRMLSALHGRELAHEVRGCGLGTEELTVPDRCRLETALDDLGDPGVWHTPLGDRVRRVLVTHDDELREALRTHDQLVDRVGPQQDDRLVLSHGELHPGNLIRGADGLALVDWDSALLAPPERDLWMVDDRTRGEASRAYAAMTGRELQPALLARYRLAWALADVADFVVSLRDADGEDADTAWMWAALQSTLHGLGALSRPGG